MIKLTVSVIQDCSTCLALLLCYYSKICQLPRGLSLLHFIALLSKVQDDSIPFHLSGNYLFICTTF